MNIGNGFILKSWEDVIDKMNSLCGASDLKESPFPFVSGKMKYYISRNNQVFGCKRHSDFYLLTPLRISKKV